MTDGIILNLIKQTLTMAITEKQKMILGTLKVLGAFSIVLFIIGVIMNYDGYQILVNQNKYKSGLLKFDSLFNSSGDQDGSGTTGFWGHVDSVNTGVRIGLSDSPEIKKLIDEISNGKEIPVWYKPDGKLTFERYPHETVFPVERILEGLTAYFVLLNLPLIVTCVVYGRLKRKYTKKM